MLNWRRKKKNQAYLLINTIIIIRDYLPASVSDLAPSMRGRKYYKIFERSGRKTVNNKTNIFWYEKMEIPEEEKSLKKNVLVTHNIRFEIKSSRGQFRSINATFFFISTNFFPFLESLSTIEGWMEGTFPLDKNP